MTDQNRSSREHKASAFTAYFGMPENAADLYRSLSHSKDICAGDIDFKTLQGVLFMARKNDLSFQVRRRVLVISEHQSTVNYNMPLRSAVYYGRTMEKIILPRDIYRSGRIPIPTPEFYAFYNGPKVQPQEQIMKLSDSYLAKTDEPMLELKVKMININPSAGHPILTESRSLYEYSYFIQKIRDYMKADLERDEAIRQAMRDCLREGIMVDFIQEHGTEVINMLFTEFNMEDALEVRGEEKYEEGLADGIAQGMAQGRTQGIVQGRAEGLEAGEVRNAIHIIRAKLAKGLSASEIADMLETDERYVSEIISSIRKHPEADDLTVAGHYLNDRSETLK